jgi:Protein of unknown function (DUF2905)
VLARAGEVVSFDESVAMSRWLVTIGLVLVVVGLLWPWLRDLGLGRLPGDVVIERGTFTSISRL